MTRPGVVNVSGHMIDAPDRSSVRFPSSEEPRVTADVRRVFGSWDVGAGTVVITGGAQGTDLIAAEQALELGADVVLCLAQPPDRFVPDSVALDGTRWTERFEAVRAAASEVAVLPDSRRDAHASIYTATNAWMIELGWARARDELDPRALLVWDGKEGDGSGGTGDFRRRLRLDGPDPARVAVIDPTARRYERRQRATPVPKRVLALDDGGVGTIVTLEILAEIERGLRRETGDPRRRLADFFDYVGGSGTGALAAGALAVGRPASELVDPDGAMVSALATSTPDVDQIAAIVGARRTLGDPDLETLLLVVTDVPGTRAPAMFTNNTAAEQNRADRYLLDPPDRQLDRSLTELLRDATTAGAHRTPMGNPAHLMYLMATAPEHELAWSSGADRLLIVSVGGGRADAGSPPASDRDASVPTDVRSADQDGLCRSVGHCRFGAPFGTEPGPVGDAAFTYVRYDADLSDRGLREHGIVDAGQRARMRRPDAIDQLDELRRIGRRAAADVDVAAHLSGFLRRPPA